MRIGKITATAAIVAAITTAAALPASAAGKPFRAPERITANKLIAPNVVQFSYRCKPNLERSIHVGLTAPETAPTTYVGKWLQRGDIVCNNRTARPATRGGCLPGQRPPPRPVGHVPRAARVPRTAPVTGQWAESNSLTTWGSALRTVVEWSNCPTSLNCWWAPWVASWRWQ